MEKTNLKLLFKNELNEPWAISENIKIKRFFQMSNNQITYQ